MRIFISSFSSRFKGLLSISKVLERLFLLDCENLNESIDLFSFFSGLIFLLDIFNQSTLLYFITDKGEMKQINRFKIKLKMMWDQVEKK